MAGLRGNVAWWAMAKQTAKGVTAAYAPSKIPFVGGGISVTRETANLAETDSSRDQGVSYVTRSGVEGGPETYVRNSSIHNLLESALGNRAVVASGTSYTVNTATAAAATSATVTAASSVLNVYTYTTSTSHGYVAGDSVTLAGVSSALTTSTAASSTAVIPVTAATNIVAGQTVTGTGVTAGTTVVSVSSLNVTVSQAVAIASGATLNFSGNNFYNGVFSVVSAPTATTFTVVGSSNSNVGTTAGTLTGTVTANKSIYTYTTSAAHGYSVGTSVGISGAANPAYNGLFLILTVPTTTTFTVAGQPSPGTTTFTSGTVSAAGTHTITPSNALPYYTFWRNQSDVLYESFTDCMTSDLTIKGEAGSPITATTAIMGRTPVRSDVQTAATSWNNNITNDVVYNYNDAQVAIGGTVGSTGLITAPVITSAVRSVEIQISNNISVQQTDDVVPYDLAVAQRTVNISFDLILEDILEYNKFFYGSTTGTTAVSSIYTAPMQVQLYKSATSSITFDIPSVAYEAFPVQPNPNGDPIVVSVRAQAQRTGDVLKPIITATVVNSNLL